MIVTPQVGGVSCISKPIVVMVIVMIQMVMAMVMRTVVMRMVVTRMLVPPHLYSSQPMVSLPSGLWLAHCRSTSSVTYLASTCRVRPDDLATHVGNEPGF